MAKANDLKIKIPLTPSQVSLLPKILKNINSESEMLMSEISLADDTLNVSCFDLTDVLAELEAVSPLEYLRFKKQSEAVLVQKIKTSNKPHHFKNFSAALQSIH